MIEVQTRQGVAFVGKAIYIDLGMLKLTGPVVRIEGDSAFLWEVQGLWIPEANVVWHAELAEEGNANRKLAQMLAGITPAP